MTAAVEGREIANHSQNGRLLSTHDVGSANEFSCATEFGPRAGRRDLRFRLAAPNQRPCVGLNPRAGLDRYRFTGEHGLIEQNFTARELHVRRNDSAERKLYHIARHHLCCGNGLPRAIALDRGGQRKPRLQRGKRRLGATFLEEAQRGVEHQQKEAIISASTDIAEHQLDHDGCYRASMGLALRRTLSKAMREWMRACVRHRVGAGFCEPAVGLVGRLATFRYDFWALAVAVDRHPAPRLPWTGSLPRSLQATMTYQDGIVFSEEGAPLTRQGPCRSRHRLNIRSRKRGHSISARARHRHHLRLRMGPRWNNLWRRGIRSLGIRTDGHS